MTPVDWTKILSKDIGAKVIHSSLCRLDAPPKCRTQLVTIWLPGDFYIDVEWNRRQGYVVALIRENFSCKIDQNEFSDVSDVISYVSVLAERAYDLHSTSQDIRSTASMATLSRTIDFSSAGRIAAAVSLLSITGS